MEIPQPEVHIVKFEASRDGGAMAIVGGRISFPKQTDEQPKPRAGETWEVELAGENPKKTVYFLKLRRKIEVVEWSWNDGMGHRNRYPACLVIAGNGQVHRFVGSDIPGLVKVLKDEYKKNGKWSHTTYYCLSPEGTKIYSWQQSWEESLYWPQASWEEALKTVQTVAPQVDFASLEAVIRQHWSSAATKFDENRMSIQKLAELSATTQAGQGDETDLVEWSWNDGMLSRGYKPVCYVVLPNAKIHKFKGESIENVCRVLNHEAEQNGKWSNTTYHCVSPTGCSIVTWSQEWDSGLYWPQTSWEEAIAWFQSKAPQADAKEIEALIRRYREPAAQKFDEHHAALASFATQTPPSQVIHLIPEQESISAMLEELQISAPSVFEASGQLGPGISGIQANTLVAGDKALVLFSLGPGGGSRYGYKEHGSSGLTILKKVDNERYTVKKIVAMIESDDWYMAWTNYKDGAITSYVLANAGGIHRFSPQWSNEVSTEPWNGFSAITPSEEEMQRVFGIRVSDPTGSPGGLS